MAIAHCPKCGTTFEVIESIGPWVLSYGDMVTNMMTFFVALLSFATFDAQKFQLVLSSFQGSIGIFDGGKSINLTPEELMNAGNSFEKLGKAKVIIRPRRDVAKALGWIEDKIGNSVSTRIEERGIVIQLTNRIMFKQGSDALNQEAGELLANIAFFLKEIVPGHEIRVEGHSDETPLDGAALRNYRSNLRLSTMRAINVYEALKNRGLEAGRMSATGYGESRPLDRLDGENDEAWRDRNRRVEIVVLRQDWVE